MTSCHFRLTLLFFFLSMCFCYSQEAGQIIPKQEADDLFGPVLEYVSFDTSVLNNLIQQTEHHMMFKIINGSVVILGDNRKVLFPAGAEIDPMEIFHLFSRTKVEQLIAMGMSQNVFIEKRDTVLSITCGESTLEFSFPCPPYCD